MDFISKYRSKLGTPEQAAKLVKSGDWVEYGNGTTFAVECDRALAKRRGLMYNQYIAQVCRESRPGAGPE